MHHIYLLYGYPLHHLPLATSSYPYDPVWTRYGNSSAYERGVEHPGPLVWHHREVCDSLMLNQPMNGSGVLLNSRKNSSRWLSEARFAIAIALPPSTFTSAKCDPLGDT
jgi:hypothetical protein